MAINPITTTRVSNGLQSQALLDQFRANQVRLFQLQQQLSTGRRLLSTRDDPLGAGRAIDYGQILDRQSQILTNIRSADSFLSATDSAISDVSGMLIQATGIASEQVNSFTSADQRAAAATIIDGIIGQLQAVGNRQFNGRYLFSGRTTDLAPLNTALGQVTYVGDDGDLLARISSGAAFGTETTAAINLTVGELFDLQSGASPTGVDLDPALSAATRLSDLGGAVGRGIRAGTIQVTQHAGPDKTFDLDLSSVDTVGDLVARFNAAASAAGASLTMSIVGDHLEIASAGGNVSVSDLGTGAAAADLGLRSNNVSTPVVGLDVDPRVRLTTKLTDLNGGAGVTLSSGIVITNGSHSATLNLSAAKTVQDVLNQLNGAGVGVRARINDSGTGIEVVNALSGSELRISENGGNDASLLGIRSFHGGTRLSSLNGGRGVGTVAGDDISITDGNGVTFTVDVDGATTVGDVIAKINTAASAAGSTLTASLAQNGNGIRLSQPSGTTPINVTRANLSPAIDDLGLSGVTGTATELGGRDVNPIKASGAFTALYELRDALLANDTARITTAGAKIEAAQRHVAAVQGQVGARSEAMQQRLQRTEDAVASTQELLSQITDVDYTEAITKFQQAQTALQANLQSGSQLLGLSLLDFLR